MLIGCSVYANNILKIILIDRLRKRGDKAVVQMSTILKFLAQSWELLNGIPSNSDRFINLKINNLIIREEHALFDLEIKKKRR